MNEGQPQLPSSVAIIREAWNLFRNRINSLLTITVVGMIIIFVISFIFSGSSAFTSGQAQSALIGIGAGVAGLAALIIGVIQQGTLISAVASAQPLSWQEAYKAGSVRFWGLLGYSVVAGIAIVIGLFLLVIPGLILAVWWSVGSFCLMLENKSAMESLKQSRAYVKGRWGAVAWRLLVLLIIVLIISIPVSAIGQLNPILASLINLVFSIIITPFAISYMYILYRGLRGEPTTNNTPIATTSAAI